MNKWFRVLHSTQHFGKLIQIIPRCNDNLSLDIYPNKYFQIDLLKYDEDNNAITLIGFSCYLWWCK